MKTIIVGHLMPERKLRELGLLEMFKENKYEYNIKLTPIDPFKSLLEQEKCNCVIHKVHDVLIDDFKFTDVQKVMGILNSFFTDALKINTPLLDSANVINVLSNRELAMSKAEGCTVNLNGITMTIPRRAVLDRTLSDSDFLSFMKEKNINFPFIVKPMGGILEKIRYDMSLHFNYSPENGKSLADLIGPTPCFIQEYHNHGGKLYKIYIIGNSWNVRIRPSIIDQDLNQTKPIYFKSNKISKKDSKSDITSKIAECDCIQTKAAGLDEEVIDAFITNFRSVFDFNLIGIDFIVSNDTKTYYIVDINYFPGYREFPNSEECFYNLFSKYANS